MLNDANTLFPDQYVVQHGKKLMVVPRRTPSRYQQAVLDDVQAGVPAICVQATAGSGKTALLEMIATTLTVTPHDKVGFLAYNVHIVKELKKRLPSTFDIRTVNSLGHQICTLNQPGLKFESRKYEDLSREHVGALDLKPAVRRELLSRLESCFALHVGHDLGLDIRLGDWSERMDELDAPAQGAEAILHQLTLRILKTGLKMVQEQGILSYTDQVLAPLVFGWRLPTPYTFLLIDELQDLSRAQMGIVQAATDPNSRLIGVGDASQSLYAFDGADQDSLKRFCELFSATARPLAISYRCPQRHVELARPHTDTIEAADNAILGSLDDLTGEEFLSLAKPGDLALCRTNAPLVEWCYRLINAGIPAVVRGRDLSRSLVALARDAATWDGTRPRREAAKDTLSLAAFPDQLSAMTQHLMDKLMQSAEREGRDADMSVANLIDRHTAIINVYAQHEPPTLGDLTVQIRALFAGDPERSIVLSTVHRAKGLEAARVFILEPDLLPHPKAASPQALAAERCVQFVAYTRSKRELFFVDAQQSKIPEPLRGRT